MSSRPSSRTSRSYHSRTGRQVVGDVVDPRVRVAHGEQPGRDGPQREVQGRHVGQLRPRERRGHRRLGHRAQRPRRADRAVAGVLVVVDEHRLAPLLLPPPRGDPTRHPALELTADGDGGMPDLGEGPPRLDPHVDVDATTAGGLRIPDPAELVEHPAQLQGDGHRVVEVRPRLRVEVDAQLVGVLDIAGSHRPGVEGDRAELGRPDDRRRRVRADLVGRPTRRERDPGGADPVGRPGGHALLVEGLPLEPLAGAQPRPRDDAARASAPVWSAGRAGRGASPRPRPSSSR